MVIQVAACPIPSLFFLRELIAFLGWTRVFEFDFSFSLWLSRLGIYRRPTHRQSNGGGGGIETREEGEIGGEKEGYRSYIVMSLLQSPTCDNVGDSENATGLG